MASYLTVMLDTTCPIISIVAPEYATVNDIIDIIVESNEELDNWNDIRIVDNNNNDISTTFIMYNNSFIGSIRVPYNISKITIHAQLRDDVWNISTIVSRSINILTYRLLKIADINEYTMIYNQSTTIRSLSIYENIMECKALSIISRTKSEVISR